MWEKPCGLEWPRKATLRGSSITHKRSSEHTTSPHHRANDDDGGDVDVDGVGEC